MLWTPKNSAQLMKLMPFATGSQKAGAQLGSAVVRTEGANQRATQSNAFKAAQAKMKEAGIDDRFTANLGFKMEELDEKGQISVMNATVAMKRIQNALQMVREQEAGKNARQKVAEGGKKDRQAKALDYDSRAIEVAVKEILNPNNVLLRKTKQGKEVQEEVKMFLQKLGESNPSVKARADAMRIALEMTEEGDDGSTSDELPAAPVK
jgi:hypothetical protein